MSDAKRRIDKRNVERSQAMAREAAETMAVERVRLEGVTHTRPQRGTEAS